MAHDKRQNREDYLRVHLDVLLTCEEVRQYTKAAKLRGQTLPAWLAGAAYAGIVCAIKNDLEAQEVTT